MTASTPPPVAAGSGPNPIEIFWERNRGLLKAIGFLIVAALLAYNGVAYYKNKQQDQLWSSFAAASFLRGTYERGETDIALMSPYESVSVILDELKATTPEHFEKAIAAAAPEQVPYLLWLLAAHSARNGDVDRATATIARLKNGYPKHTLVVESPYPIQVRERKKKDRNKEEPKDKPKPPEDEEPELLPAKAGSAAEDLLARLRTAKDFVAPPHFARPEIPADAPRYKIAFEGDYGEFTIALMTAAAPKHCEKFQWLVEQKFWDGVKVDEIARPGKSRWADQVRQMHFGFESTKTAPSRSDWDTSVPSKAEHVVEEISPLSHFEGAIAARNRDGKSEVDRLYICGSDAASQDESRQVFAYVVDGIETVRRICDATFEKAEDEDRGRGLPSENIAIKSVTKL